MSIGNLSNGDPGRDPVAEDLRGKFFGEHMAEVMDTQDPMQRGRVRAHIPAIMVGTNKNRQESWSDWLLPKSIGCIVPPVGQSIVVTYEHGKIGSGFYEWGWLTGNNAETSAAPLTARGRPDPTYAQEAEAASAGVGPEVIANVPQDPARATPPKYPENRAFSLGGFILELDASPGEERLRVLHPTGTQVLVDAAGNLHIRSAGEIIYESKGDVTYKMAIGCTFRVVSEGGTSLAIGVGGAHITGHIITLNKRSVTKTGNPIK